MARLVSGDLALEVFFKTFDEANWIQYEIGFTWREEPLINDAILKRINAHWADRAPGTFKANDDGEDSLLSTIERVLETNQAGAWEPIEPDAIMAFYPESFFPFLPSKRQVIYMSPMIQREQEDRRRRKEAQGGKLPDDLITVAILIDQYNLAGSVEYAGDGPALLLVVRRTALETFYFDLAGEYLAFIERFRVDDANFADFHEDLAATPTGARVCPSLRVWERIYRVLQAERIRQRRFDIPLVPAPPRFNDWYRTSAQEKAARWAATLAWAQTQGCVAWTHVDDADWYREEATGDRLEP